MKKVLSLILSLVMLTSVSAGLDITAFAQSSPAVSLSSVSTKSNYLIVKFKRLSKKKENKITGYEVQWSTNKNFKKSKYSQLYSSYDTPVKRAKRGKNISVRIYAKSGKRYYVRVRSISTSLYGSSTNDIKSKWSKVKTAKIKKIKRLSKKVKYIKANKKDIKNFEKMVDKSYTVWDSWYDEYRSYPEKNEIKFSKLSQSEIIDKYIYFNSYGGNGLYNSFFGYKITEMGNYTDPKGKYDFYAKLDANNVDWILKNVFNKKPNRKISDKNYYYNGKYVYRKKGEGGGGDITYKVADYELLPNGKYRIYVHRYIEYSQTTNICFTAKLKKDKKMGRYWALDKVNYNY